MSNMLYVSGFGDIDANGIYVESGYFDGLPYYVKDLNYLVIYTLEYMPYSKTPSYYIVKITQIPGAVRIAIPEFKNNSNYVADPWMALLDLHSGEVTVGDVNELSSSSSSLSSSSSTLWRSSSSSSSLSSSSSSSTFWRTSSSSSLIFSSSSLSISSTSSISLNPESESSMSNCPSNCTAIPDVLTATLSGNVTQGEFLPCCNTISGTVFTLTKTSIPDGCEWSVDSPCGGTLFLTCTYNWVFGNSGYGFWNKAKSEDPRGVYVWNGGPCEGTGTTITIS